MKAETPPWARSDSGQHHRALPSFSSYFVGNSFWIYEQENNNHRLIIGIIIIASE